jgi:hypothetical protein
MKFNKILLLLLLPFFWACQDKKAKPDGFEIKGAVSGLGNAKVLVLKFVNGGLELDSIQASNDEFEYSGKVKEPYFVQLLLQNGDSTSGKLTEFMLENSLITISGNATAYDSVQVSGSVSDEVLKAYFKEDEVLSAQWDQLKEQYDLAMQSGDTVQRKQLAKKLNTIFQVDRVNLLKKYVAENANATIGALLPAFCSIEDALTQEDYQEIYDMLADDIKMTDYGKNIAERAGLESKNP